MLAERLDLLPLEAVHLSHDLPHLLGFHYDASGCLQTLSNLLSRVDDLVVVDQCLHVLTDSIILL